MPGADPVMSRRLWMTVSAGCLTTAGFAISAVNTFADESWTKTRQDVSKLVAAYQFEKAHQLVSDYIKANPQVAPAYEQRAWVTLDWLDLRDDIALPDLPLRRRYMSDPATGVSAIDPPLEIRRLYLQERFNEKYAPPAELKSAEEDLAEFRRLTGRPADGVAIEAFIAEFIGDLPRAKQLLAPRCADGKGSPREYLILSRIQQAERDRAGSLSSVEQALKSPETRNQAIPRKLTLLRTTNRPQQAAELFELWEQTSPNDVRFLFTRSSYTLDKTVPIKDLERLMAIMPNEAGFFYSMSARDIQILKDTDACMGHLNQAVKLNPRSLLPYFARSCLKIKLGDAPGALADIDAAIKCSPYFDASYQIRSRIYQKMEDTEAARRDDLRRVWLRDLYQLAANCQAKPNNAEAAYLLGKHYARGEDWNRAMQSLAICLKHSPKHVEAMRQRVQIYLAVNRSDLALTHANKIIEIDGDPANYSLRGDIHALRKDWDAATNDYENARCLDDRLENALRQRAAWHKAAGRIEQATADLERAGSITSVSFEVPQ